MPKPQRTIFREESYKIPAQISIESLMSSLNVIFNEKDKVQFKVAQNLLTELAQHNKDLYWDLAPSKFSIGLEEADYKKRVLSYVSKCRNSLKTYGPKLMTEPGTIEQTKATFAAFLEHYGGVEQTKIKGRGSTTIAPEVIEAFLNAKKALKEAKETPVPDLSEPVVVFGK